MKREETHSTPNDKLITVDMQVMEHDGENFFKISDHDAMRPFFMSIVSDANHWMFISSNGGLTAGRKNPEYALFPYYTDDKITESAEITGSKTIFQILTNEDVIIWEPFSERMNDKFAFTRNLYKSIYGNKIMFEEINHDLKLTFRYQWSSSRIYGFVRKAEIINNSETACKIILLDGIQNIMPHGVSSDLQRATSNLVDAYKRSELEQSSGIGIFALSAIISDKAEPSEALKANIAWSIGIDNPTYLLSSQQLQRFREKHEIHGESDIKGEKGAYYVSSEIELPAGGTKNWKIISNVNQNHSQIISLRNEIKEDRLIEKRIQDDVSTGTKNIIHLVSGADGLQFTADKLIDTRHFSNVLFNIMRGGIFDDNYNIKKEDFLCYLSNANQAVASGNQDHISKLPVVFSQSELIEFISEIEDANLVRLSYEYLPLKFSRRHGDPSRPWNYFSINIQDETDGSEILDYEGNWRDIFQNWEAMAHSFPGFIKGMIFKFLNASTFDGYNPYRVTKGGFDWETIEPDNPWSYIGYWGDHQIIYLQKFLEFIEKYYPGTLESLFDKEWFVYAAVPYKIKTYDQILKNPKDTVEFDHQWDREIRKQRELTGADGTLLADKGNEIHHVIFLEKILATVLAKMSNFIPGAGIWMNTQRPEWNDANNALVGNGVSMVTLCYLHRFMKFLQNLISISEKERIKVSVELMEFFDKVVDTLSEHHQALSGSIDDSQKKVIMDSLGQAASAYRQHIYQNGFSGEKGIIPMAEVKKFTEVCIEYMQHSIRTNQRTDKLFHAYNILTINHSTVSISHLDEMLEGQVAVLSANYLTAAEALEVLDALKNSSLYRADQNSYILYPEKQLPGFLEKNHISISDAQSSVLIKTLINAGNKEIIEQDVEGNLHFNGNFRNAGDLSKALDKMAKSGYEEMVVQDRTLLLNIFEKVFNHKAFTGRSGTFYAYEGLGSIYWHMVSKLNLAVQECYLKAIDERSDTALIGRLSEHYFEIDAGIGVHKSPVLYGAFPTDPYSHTPKHRGAQQPGMTGQVKEDILIRFAELGVTVKKGQLIFDPQLLRKEEFLHESNAYSYQSIDGHMKQMTIGKGQLGFTYCMVPVIYTISETEYIRVFYTNGRRETVNGKALSEETSSLIFNRTGEIESLEVCVNLR